MKLNFNNTTLDISSNGKMFTLTLDDKTIRAELLHSENGKLDFLVDGKRVVAYVSSENAKRWVTVNGQTFVLTKSSGLRQRGHAHHHNQ